MTVMLLHLRPDFDSLQVKTQSFNRGSFRDTRATAIVLETHKNEEKQIL